jgi:hypothetical protein
LRHQLNNSISRNSNICSSSCGNIKKVAAKAAKTVSKQRDIDYNNSIIDSINKVAVITAATATASARRVGTLITAATVGTVSTKQQNK